MGFLPPKDAEVTTMFFVEKEAPAEFSELSDIMHREIGSLRIRLLYNIKGPYLISYTNRIDENGSLIYRATTSCKGTFTWFGRWYIVFMALCDRVQLQEGPIE